MLTCKRHKLLFKKIKYQINLLRVRQTQDRQRHGCRVRLEEAGPHFVRFRRLYRNAHQSTSIMMMKKINQKAQKVGRTRKGEGKGDIVFIIFCFFVL